MRLIAEYLGHALKVAILLLLMAVPTSAQSSKACDTLPAYPTSLTVKNDQPIGFGFCGEQTDNASWDLEIDGKRAGLSLSRDETASAISKLFYFRTPDLRALLPVGTHTVDIAPFSSAINGAKLTPLPTPITIVVLAATAVPVDCAVSAWSDWSAWSAWTATSSTQEQRTQTRTRTVTTDAANGGAACPVLSETATETRAITAPPDACAADPLSLFVTRWTQTTGLPTSRMQVNFQLASRTPVVQVQAKIDDRVVADTGVGTSDLAVFGAIWFVTPASGTHKLSVWAKNAAGCAKETPSPVALKVK